MSGVRSDIGPYGLVPRWVAERVSSPSAYMVYGVLASFADKNTGASFPSRTSLAKICKCSVKTIDRAVNELQEIGALAVEPRFVESDDTGARRQTSNAYTVITRHPDVSLPSDMHVAPPEDTHGAPGGDTHVAPGTTPNELDHEGTTSIARMREETYNPLKGRRVNGRDLPWDALAGLTEATGSANGPRMKRALKSIREEVVDQIRAENEHGGVGFDDPVAGALIRFGGWEGFEAALAEEITKRGQALIRMSPGLTWGPEGIARNWRKAATADTDVEGIAEQAVNATRARAAS